MAMTYEIATRLGREFHRGILPDSSVPRQFLSAPAHEASTRGVDARQVGVRLWRPLDDAIPG